MPTYITIAESINANTCSYNRKIYIPPVYFYVAKYICFTWNTKGQRGREWERRGGGMGDIFGSVDSSVMQSRVVAGSQGGSGYGGVTPSTVYTHRRGVVSIDE